MRQGYQRPQGASGGPSPAPGRFFCLCSPRQCQTAALACLQRAICRGFPLSEVLHCGPRGAPRIGQRGQTQAPHWAICLHSSLGSSLWGPSSLGGSICAHKSPYMLVNPPKGYLINAPNDYSTMKYFILIPTTLVLIVCYFSFPSKAVTFHFSMLLKSF